MKKKYIIFAAALMMSFAIAAIAAMPTTNTTIEVTREQRTALADKGITELEVSELVCDANRCRFTLFQDGGIDKTIWIDNTPRSLAEYRASRDTAIRSELEGIADAEIERQARRETTELGPGIITISERT